ncbi:MAG: nuclear transport factor 2 family protein [Caulobacterales bacterium]
MSGRGAFDMEAAMRDYVARRDIVDCVCRYMRGQDRLDAAQQRSAFHDDAYVDCGPFAGAPDHYVAFAQGGLAGCAYTHHMIGQVQLTIDGDRASGEVYFIAYHRIPLNGADKDMIFGGRYVDEYACRNGDWRIAKRREIADWTRTIDPADDFLKLEPAYHRPGRRGADFSEMRDWPRWPE